MRRSPQTQGRDQPAPYDPEGSSYGGNFTPPPTTVAVDVYNEESHFVGATSGLSFLQQAVQHIGRQDDSNTTGDAKYQSPASESIFSSGDVPPTSYPTERFQLPSREESSQMLARYFDFATPTYRFFHRPTVEKWADQLLDNSSKGHDPVENVRYAVVYLIWAQAIKYEDGVESRPGKR